MPARVGGTASRPALTTTAIPINSPNKERMNTRIALGAGALALPIGAFGPWATFLGAINIGLVRCSEPAVA